MNDITREQSVQKQQMNDITREQSVKNMQMNDKRSIYTLRRLIHQDIETASPYEPRQANLCLRAFRHDKF